MTETLQVAPRTMSAKAVRKMGDIPAIVYGPKQEPISIAVNKALFEKTLKGSGESTVIKLVGLDRAFDVLIHDVSHDAILGGVEHVDFYALEKGKEITVHVPLEFIGEAPAVKKSGSLIKVLHEVEVTCNPSALPQHITVDVSSLDTFEKKIHVKDLDIPKGVKVTNDGEEVIVMVKEAVEEVEPEVVVEPTAAEGEEKGTEEPAS